MLLYTIHLENIKSLQAKSRNKPSKLYTSNLQTKLVGGTRMFTDRLSAETMVFPSPYDDPYVPEFSMFSAELAVGGGGGLEKFYVFINIKETASE